MPLSSAGGESDPGIPTARVSALRRLRCGDDLEQPPLPRDAAKLTPSNLAQRHRPSNASAMSPETRIWPSPASPMTRAAAWTASPVTCSPRKSILVGHLSNAAGGSRRQVVGALDPRRHGSTSAYGCQSESTGVAARGSETGPIPRAYIVPQARYQLSISPALSAWADARWRSPVRLAPVPHADDRHQQLFVPHLVDDAVIPYSKPPEFLRAAQFRRPSPRVGCQTVDRSPDPPPRPDI
jgi:hypothetical protein